MLWIFGPNNLGYFMTIWYILCSFGNFFSIFGVMYLVPRKIWQPCRRRPQRPNCRQRGAHKKGRSADKYVRTNIMTLSEYSWVDNQKPVVTRHDIVSYYREALARPLALNTFDECAKIRVCQIKFPAELAWQNVSKFAIFQFWFKVSTLWTKVSSSGDRASVSRFFRCIAKHLHWSNFDIIA
jgi:hypothetical protein